MKTIKLNLETARKVGWELKKTNTAHSVKKSDDRREYIIHCNQPPDTVKFFFK